MIYCNESLPFIGIADFLLVAMRWISLDTTPELHTHATHQFAWCIWLTKECICLKISSIVIVVMVV